MERQIIIYALHRFISQRSGIDSQDYGNRESFIEDCKQIVKDGRMAREMLWVVEFSSMPSEVLLDSFRAFSGRLKFENGNCEYIIGQYFPTEYRLAACAVLAAALRNWYGRDANGEAWLEGHTDRALNWAKRHLRRSTVRIWFK
jgi:hypothetical protein